MPKMGRRGGFSHFRPCRALARLRAQKQKIIRARLPTALDKKQPQSLKSFGVSALLKNQQIIPFSIQFITEGYSSL